MKYAIIDGLKCEAQPKLRGYCPGCNEEMIAKCGDIKIRHWAHVSVRNCDHWWEPEKPWHRDWKNQFLEQYQEKPLRAPDGELHIADVLTESGTVLEFQHSPISSSERASREHFYKRMNWVVNGLRVPRDLPSFRKALGAALVIRTDPLQVQLPIKACTILERWAGSLCPVYLDFGDAKFHLLNGPVLWRLRFLKEGSFVIATPVSRQSFIEHHRDNVPLRIFRLPPPKAPVPQPKTLLSRPQSRPRNPLRTETYLRSFDRYLLNQVSRRKRF